MRKLIAAALIAAGLSLPVGSVSVANAAGSCPQYNGMLAAYGLPVGFFSRVMYRESHCIATAFHRNRNGTIDRGLLQINSIHLRGVARGYSPNSLYSPSVNLSVAAKLYRMAGTRPWR